jgi:hypothetical protein
MVETWEHLLGVPMVCPVRRSPMDALDVERSIAEAAIPAAGPIASDVRFKKRVLGSLAIHFALIPVFPQSEKARCLLEKDTKS